MTTPATPPLQRCGPYLLGPRLASSEHADLYPARTQAEIEACYILKRLHRADAAALAVLRERVAWLAPGRACPHLIIPFEIEALEQKVCLLRASPPALELGQLLDEVRRRQLGLGHEVALAVVLDVLEGLTALHELRDAIGTPLAHGAVNASHVLITKSGEALLLGAESPRTHGAAACRLDVAGAAALLYEVLNAGAGRPLPAAQLAQQRALRARIEPLIVRGLGIASEDARASSARDLALALRDALQAAGSRADREVLGALVRQLGTAQPPALPPMGATPSSSPGLRALTVAQPAPVDFGEPAPAPPSRATEATGRFERPGPEAIDDGADPAELPAAALRPLAPTLPAPPTATTTAPTPRPPATPPAPATATASTPRPPAIPPAPPETAAATAPPVSPPPPGAPVPSGSPAAPAAPTRENLPPRATGPDRRRLGEILVEHGAVSPAAVQAALAAQPQQGGRLGEILQRMGVLDDAALATALSQQSGLPAMSDAELRALQVPLPLLNALPEAYASAKRILPIDLDAAARSVTLVVADPYDRATVNEARILVAAQVAEVRVATRGVLETTIRRVYQSRGVQTVGEGGALLLLATANQTLADSLSVRLAAEGFRVRHVVDGQLARTALEADDVAALICELSLPRVDGYNLILTARSREAYRDLPIFAFSSLADDYHMSKALELGADDFLPVPLNQDFLVSKLRRSVVRRPAPATEAAPALPVPAGGVAGTLSDMALTEIVQTIELGRKTATIAIRLSDGPSGLIGFVGGQVTHASAGELRGDAAFYALAAPREGTFQIRYGETQAERNVDNSTTFLLLEAMRRQNERG